MSRSARPELVLVLSDGEPHRNVLDQLPIGTYYRHVKRATLVAAVFVLSACQAAPPAIPVPSVSNGSSSFVVSLGEGIQLSLPGRASSTSSPDSACASQVFELKTSGGEYQAVLLAPGCTATTAIPENGDHGFYPSPPATAKVDWVSTPVGDAIVFSNQYSDCYSSCYMGTDEVALVSIANRVVQVIAPSSPAAGTTDRDRAGLVAVLQGLRRG